MSTIRELEEGAAAVAVPSTSMAKKRKTSLNEETKKELLERRLMGADVTMDLTGLYDDEEDAFDAYRLALVSSQFVSGEAAASSSSSTSAICISEATAPRLEEDPACPVFIYTPPKETAESTQISKHLEDFPKGIAYEITSAKKIVSERFNTENYAVVLNDKFGTFLPTRFTLFINEMGLEEFLNSRPHAIYFGKNPTMPM